MNVNKQWKGSLKQRSKGTAQLLLKQTYKNNSEGALEVHLKGI